MNFLEMIQIISTHLKECQNFRFQDFIDLYHNTTSDQTKFTKLFFVATDGYLFFVVTEGSDLGTYF